MPLYAELLSLCWPTGITSVRTAQVQGVSTHVVTNVVIKYWWIVWLYFRQWLSLSPIVYCPSTISFHKIASAPRFKIIFAVMQVPSRRMGIQRQDGLILGCWKVKFWIKKLNWKHFLEWWKYISRFKTSRSWCNYLKWWKFCGLSL